MTDTFTRKIPNFVSDMDLIGYLYKKALNGVHSARVFVKYLWQ